MFLLNSEMIKKYMDKKVLGIDKFDEPSLVSTHYYFHLGEYCDIWDSKNQEYTTVNISKERQLILPPGGVATVKSYESFFCSEQVLGILGISSDLLLRSGVVAYLSPAMNPLFSGHLEFALQNIRDVNQSVPFRARVGKAVFFDVSDTYPVGNEWYGNDSHKRDRRVVSDQLMTPEAYMRLDEEYGNFRAL